MDTFLVRDGDTAKADGDGDTRRRCYTALRHALCWQTIFDVETLRAKLKAACEKAATEATARGEAEASEPATL